MSEDRPPVEDRLQALGALNLGEDPGPEAVEAVLRRWTMTLNGADPLREKLERDALAELPGLSAGKVDAALKAARSHQPPEETETDEPDTEELTALQEEGQEILEAPDQLALFRDALGDIDYAGDSAPLELVHVALHSRNLPRPIGLVLKGPSAAGKTFTVETARRFHPTDAVLSLEGMSERYLAYVQAPTAHRYVLIAEGDAFHDEGAGLSILRSLAWGEGIRYGTVVVTDQGPQAVEIEKPGPTGLITTSTQALQEEIETRLISLPITDTPEQTRDVVREQAEAAAGRRPPEPDLSAWTAASRLLAAAGEKRVVVPFALDLAEAVPTKDVRMRRDFTQVLSVIRALAFMHQIRRERDERGRVVAHAYDYAHARRLLAPVLHVTQSAVTEEVREAVAAVRRLNEQRAGVADPGISYSKLGDELGLTRQGARYRAQAALRGGWLANAEDRNGYPARLVTGDPLPTEEPILPPADELFGDDSDVYNLPQGKSPLQLSGAVESAGAAGDTSGKRTGRSSPPVKNDPALHDRELSGELSGATARRGGENDERGKAESENSGGTSTHTDSPASEATLQRLRKLAQHPDLPDAAEPIVADWIEQGLTEAEATERIDKLTDRIEGGGGE